MDESDKKKIAEVIDAMAARSIDDVSVGAPSDPILNLLRDFAYSGKYEAFSKALIAHRRKFPVNSRYLRQRIPGFIVNSLHKRAGSDAKNFSEFMDSFAEFSDQLREHVYDPETFVAVIDQLDAHIRKPTAS